MTCFFLDTNVLFKVGFVRDLSRKCVDRRHRICVSALVHMERVSQLRREKGDAYDPAAVEAFIRTHGRLHISGQAGTHAIFALLHS